jgi:hypothetical protein
MCVKSFTHKFDFYSEFPSDFARSQEGNDRIESIDERLGEVLTLGRLIMTQALTGSGGLANKGSTMSVSMALKIAWGCWIVLLVVPFGIFLALVWRLGVVEKMGAPPVGAGQGWFLAMSAYLLLVVPGSFFWRGHVFKAYWSGHPVAPGKYLEGMVSIWVALEVGGILSLVGCCVSNAMLPSLLPALIAFMFFVSMWPSGRAMFRRVGNHGDASIYEEPS